MKKFLKYLPVGIISVITFLIKVPMITIWVLVTVCVKATELICDWLICALYPDEDTDEWFEEMNEDTNLVCNIFYTGFIDLMYPVEKDNEEDDEDEEF